jgi:hypothetical protein
MEDRRGGYFTRGNPWTTFGGGYLSSGIYAMGFGVNTDLDQPTGTCNFSRIDTALLHLRTKAAVIQNIEASNTVTVTESMTTVGANVLNTLLVWGPNFNVLRIMNGMGGMAFAN